MCSFFSFMVSRSLIVAVEFHLFDEEAGEQKKSCSVLLSILEFHLFKKKKGGLSFAHTHILVTMLEKIVIHV